jgi:hypothetical protein
MTQTEVLDALRICAEGRPEDGWQTVQLNIAQARGTPNHIFADHLAELQRTGLYKPSDKRGWGEVFVAKPDPLATKRFEVRANEARYFLLAGHRVEYDVINGRRVDYVYARDSDEVIAVIRRFENNPIEIEAKREQERLDTFKELQKTKERNVALWVVVTIILFGLLAFLL